MPMEHEPTRPPRDLPVVYGLLFQAILAVLVVWWGVRQFGVTVGLGGGVPIFAALLVAFLYDRRRQRGRSRRPQAKSLR